MRQHIIGMAKVAIHGIARILDVGMDSAIKTIVVVLILAWAVVRFTPDTDPTRPWMSVRTDDATGCEYLVRFAGITPRLDATGRPICTRPATTTPNPEEPRT